MERHRIAIIIPALNEERTIASVIAGSIAYGVPIVVDDGSHDATAIIAEKSGASVVSHTRNLGYDQALNSGFEQAEKLGCQYVITIDADGQHNPSIIGSFIEALDGGADVVVGARDRLQRMGEHVFSWVARIKWKIRDPLCGMKAYKLSVYRELGYFDSYGSIGTELTIYAARNHKHIVQINIKTRDRVDAPRFGRRFTANMRLLKAVLAVI